MNAATSNQPDRGNAKKRVGQETSSNDLALRKISDLIEGFSSTRKKVDFERKKLPDLREPELHYNPMAGSWNVFRTLVISNIPQEATMTELLDQVRGGVVVDAKLLDTISITGAKTAIVVFLYERTAIALEAYARRYPIVINTQTTITTLLKTPTWPALGQQDNFDGTRTRCLEVSKYPRNISPSELRHQFRVSSALKWDRIEHMVLRDDNVLMIRFHSMADAAVAKTRFESFRNFQGCVVKFAPDPCAQPLRAKGESDAKKAHEIKLVAMKELMRADDACKAEFPPDHEEGRLSKVELKDPGVVSHGREFGNRDGASVRGLRCQCTMERSG